MGLFSGILGLATSIFGSKSQDKAADRATGAQVDATNRGIDVSEKQFAEIQKLLAPFVAGGQSGIGGALDLVGLSGPEAEAAAIEQIQGSPTFGALAQQGEEAILQNASATGGLRGGNVQGALAQFRPGLLNSLINQRFGQQMGIAQLGQASAAGVGNAGLQTGANVSNLLLEQGQAIGQGALAQGQNRANLFGDIGAGIGEIFGGQKFAAGF